MKLLYDKWFLGKPLANCLSIDVLNYIFLNYNTNIENNNLSFKLEHTFGNKHNCWLSNIGLKTKQLQFISDINLDNWVYPIEPWGHLMYSLNVEAKDDYANFFEKIPKTIVNKINDDKGKLLINYSHEGWVSDWLLKGMYLGAKNNGIKFDNIIIILNDYNLESKLKTFKENHNIEHYPKVINYSYYLTASSKHFYYKHENKNLINKHLLLNKPYKFLSLNRRLDLHRVKLLSEILNEIIFDSIISFDKKLITNQVPLLFDKEPMLKEKFDLLPDKVIADREDIENTNGYAHENENLFLDSYISIVTETSFYIDNDFISEKVWKPLYQFHPFIVVGRPHLLKYLKEIGFKTFDWIIDETYDTIEDDKLRMEAIIKEIKKLNKLSLDEIEFKIHQNFDKLEHNHTMLNNFGKQTETIEQFLIKKIKEDNYSYTDIYKELEINLNTNLI
jgi:hypothetical protein